MSRGAIEGAIGLRDRVGPAKAGHYRSDEHPIADGETDRDHGDMLETVEGEKVN